MITGKKGVLDIIMLVVMLVVFSLALFLGSHVTQEAVDKLQTTDMNDSDAASGAFIKAEQVISMMDVVFLIVFFALIFGLFISVFMTNVHPAFVVVFILLSVISVFLAIPFSNAYEKMYGLGSLATTAAKFPMQNQIMSNMPLMVLIVSMIGIIILFAKAKAPEAGGIA